jgi:hypothetical protein
MRRSRLALGIALCSALAASVIEPARAAADDDFDPGGALTAHLLIADGDLGGAVLLDVWAVHEWLRIGGFVGAGAIPSETDSRNRVMMPFGISFGAEVSWGELLALHARVRAGLWTGATQSEKLTIGVFFGGGAYLGFQIGHGAVVQVGADVWGLIGSDAWRDPTVEAVSASTWVIAPGVGLTWVPEGESP